MNIINQKEVSRLEVVAGFIFLILYIVGTVYIIQFVIPEGLVSSISSVTEEWINVARTLNLTRENSNIQAMVMDELVILAFMAQIGRWVTALIGLVGVALSLSLILRGLRNRRK